MLARLNIRDEIVGLLKKNISFRETMKRNKEKKRKDSSQ